MSKTPEEIELFNRAVDNRLFIPVALRPKLDETQQQFANELKQGKILEGTTIVLKLVRDGIYEGEKERLFIFDNKTKSTSGDLIGFVNLAGFSYPNQYEVDICGWLDPEYRGKGMLEAAIENFSAYLHYHGVQAINFDNENTFF